MSFLARVVRFLMWLLVLSWGLRLLRHIVGAMLRKNQGLAPKSTDSADGIPAASTARRWCAIRCAACTWTKTRSIPLREGGELVHFCSPACRDAYAGNVRKFCGERIKRIYIK